MPAFSRFVFILSRKLSFYNIYLFMSTLYIHIYVKTTSLPSKTIRQIVHSSPQRNIFSDAGVCCIPRKNCKLKYDGETSRNLHVRLKEHKRDLRIGNLNNGPFQHISRSNHKFDLSFAKMLIYIHNKRQRRFFEAVAISHINSLNIYIYIYIY